MSIVDKILNELKIMSLGNVHGGNKPTKYGQNGLVFQNCQCMPAGFQFLKKNQTTIVIL